MKPLFDPVSLRLFVAVCEEQNIARAADREAIVPSAISKRIAALEDQVGVPLISRGRRGIKPTPAGEVLLRQAHEVLSTMERMHAELAKALQAADVRQKFAELIDMEILGSTPAAFAAFQKAEQERWFKVIQDNNIKAE